MGRLGALLRPTWRSYAGPPQGHYKAPLCCELLMKGMLCGSLLSHRSAVARELDLQGVVDTENQVTRFPAGREGGAVRHQRRESHRRWLIDVMLIMPMT